MYSLPSLEWPEKAGLIRVTSHSKALKEVRKQTLNAGCSRPSGVLNTLLTESRSAWLEISEETSRQKRKKVQTCCKQANQESEWTGKLAEQHKGSTFRLVDVNLQQNQWVCLSFSAAYT